MVAPLRGGSRDGLSRCGHDNPEGSRFCSQCDDVPQLVFASCQAVHRPGARFCNRCGTEFSTLNSSAVRPNGPAITMPSNDSASSCFERRVLSARLRADAEASYHPPAVVVLTGHGIQLLADLPPDREARLLVTARGRSRHLSPFWPIQVTVRLTLSGTSHGSFASPATRASGGSRARADGAAGSSGGSTAVASTVSSTATAMPSGSVL